MCRGNFTAFGGGAADCESAGGTSIDRFSKPLP